MIPIPPELVDLLQHSRRIVVVTGAGISAESGVPTFRDAMTGLWAQYEPAELATPVAFRRDPKLVWDWYCWRRDVVLGVTPNAGHRALAEWQNAREFDEFLLVTQNVDGLHQQAGSRDVIELHGSIMRARCFERGHIADQWPEKDSDTENPPQCRTCNSFLRPDVVWFGEALPAASLQKAMASAEQCDVLLSIGTSSVVYPAAAIAEIALHRGAPVIEINPSESPLSKQATWSLRGQAGEILPTIVQSIRLVGW
jgi:NAD-dependent deacetylase